MKNQNIIFTAPGIAELIEREVGEPEAGKILVRTVRDTISAGTERANLVGNPNVSPAKGSNVTFPRQCGYSISGVVEAIGEGVEGFSVGDRVFCAWSKHAQYNMMKAENVYHLDDAIDFDEAALIHIATFPMAAIRKCRLEVGESALVMGLGVLGLIGVELLRAAGAVPIIAVDPVASKREQALALGADYALDPFAEGFAETVKQITGGGAKVALEITGNGGGMDMALDCMARFGRMALLGCTRSSDFSIDYYRKVHWPGITLIGAHTKARPELESSAGWWTEADDERAVMRMLAHRRLDFKCLIEEVYAPEEAPAVFTRLATDKFFPIVQFDWTRLEEQK
jgi:threonine dehydrogenase-like Zn-dependent dehydrogenase